ncbi:HlyD family efflux transporter periplasmic adaptor subunit [Okeanomitos corallinicola TIOX110]|uniref:HlyD family efflux transporter periplasmic adaptor subunit n=1 Tax=Okeanomitos corallinicola TIOX110 TaxID=3133117 RepID=A0ABZ2UVL4_9CYAN
MPYPSLNSSSALTKDKDNEYLKNDQNTDINIERNQQTPEDCNDDLHYATKDLLDALPKLWSHGILYVLIGFTIIGIPWATLSKVDETGTAKGRIEPQGSTQKLDSQASGSVTFVKVKEGDLVETGQILLELNSDVLQTELQQIEVKLSGLLNQKAQLNLLKNQIQLTLNTQEQQNQSQALEKLSQVNQAQQNLEIKQGVYNLQRLEKQSLVNQVKQQINTSQNDNKSAQVRLDIDSKQVKRFSNLLKDGAVSATQIDELIKQEQESKRVYEKTKSDIEQTKFRLTEEQSRYQTTVNQLQADIEQAKLQLQEAENSYQSSVQAGKLAILKTQEQLKDIETQITTLQSQIAQTKSQITSINIQLQQRIVRSPINGIIFELPITKPGAVIQSGQRIAQIAPKNANLILKAQMPSQDSGFLKLGMPVKVKFDAYPFQEYGIVPGQVTWISPDAKVNQTPQGNIGIYELEITLEQQYIQNGNKRIILTAGQTATAEVIIRQRRIIDFVLDPFKKLQKNGLEL